MTDFKLIAKTRTLVGKKVKQLRRAGEVPAILYGHGTDNVNLSFNLVDFNRIYRDAGTSNLIDLKIDDEKSVKVLLREPSVHPVTNFATHVDVYKVKMTEKLTTEIPLSFINESPAVIDLEGSLVTNRDALEIECLPGDLVSEFEVDLSVLKTFDDVIKISDIKIPSTIEVKDDPEEIVAQVMPPRSEEEMAELEEEVKEDVEAVEVTGEKPTEGEEATEGEAAEDGDAKPEDKAE